MLTSVTALALCVVMLVGTTFAWFTDTATTNVNKIQAGNLDVELQVQRGNDWVDAKDKTLEWVKAAAGAGQELLWEPGASYDLEPFRIVNKGNLNLKYKVVITGATGDVELLNVIDFEGSITEGGREPVTTPANTNLSAVNMNDNAAVVKDRVLTPGQYDEVTLKGTMQTTAGNTYMNKTVSGISITVYAAQATGEYDSFRNDYDADAAYPTVAPVLNTTDSKDVTLTNNALPATTIEANGATSTIPANTTMTGVTATTGAGKLERVITTKVTSDTDGNDVATYDISYNFVQGDTTTAVTEFSSVVTNKIQLSAGLTDVKVTHTHGTSTTDMIAASNETANEDGYFYYNATTGLLTIWSSKYSSFAVSYKVNFAAAIGDQYFATLTEAVKAAKDGDTIVLVKDSVGGGLMLAANAKNIIIDFNGHTYAVSNLVGSSSSENQAAHFEKGNAVTLKNGTLKVADSAASDAKILVQNYCNLTASNMTFDGTNLMLKSQQPVTLSNNGSTSVFEKCTVIAANRDNSIAIDSSVWGSYTDTDVTLKNCTVYGDLDISQYVQKADKSWVRAEGVAKNDKGQPCITVIDGAYTDLADAVLYAADGATISLLSDVEQNSTLSIAKDMTLDLNGKTIYNTKDIWYEAPKDSGKDNQVALISIDDGANVTFTGNGKVAAKENDCYGIAVDNGSLTIKNGEYIGNVSAVQVNVGKLTIEGGKFSLLQKWKGKSTYLINCIDANYKNGTAQVSITGGTFEGSDMSASTSENPAAKFVAEGYKSVENDGWYTVVKA